MYKSYSLVCDINKIRELFYDFVLLFNCSPTSQSAKYYFLALEPWPEKSTGQAFSMMPDKN